MIIEFIGLPGAGKSTIVDNIIQEFSQENLLNFQQYKIELLSSKKAKINFYLFLIIKIWLWVPFLYVLYKNSQNRRKSLERFKSLFVLLYCLKKYDRASILIMDQGLYQMLISLFIYDKAYHTININTVAKKLLSQINIKDYMLIKVNIDRNIAEERIKQRDKATCEFRQMNLVDRTFVLQKYEFLLTTINESYSCSSLNNAMSNAHLIMNFILKKSN